MSVASRQDNAWPDDANIYGPLKDVGAQPDVLPGWDMPMKKKKKYWDEGECSELLV